MAGTRLSRRKLSAYLADELIAGNKPPGVVMEQAAAYLIETRQTHDVDLLVRDIEEQLMTKGIVVADVMTARPISAGDTSSLKNLLGAKELQVRESVDPSLLGGIRVDVSGKRYDATLRRKINQLKSAER